MTLDRAQRERLDAYLTAGPPDEISEEGCEMLELLLGELEERLDTFESLVRWLALPYMTTAIDGRATVKTPIFAGYDFFNKKPLETGPKLTALWAELFGPSEPPAPGRWVRCGSCGAYNVETVPPGSVTPDELDAGLEALRAGRIAADDPMYPDFYPKGWAATDPFIPAEGLRIVARAEARDGAQWGPPAGANRADGPSY